MRARAVLAVGLKAFRLGVKETGHEWPVMVGAFLVYAVTVSAYAGVFSHTPVEDLARHGITRSMMIWYLASTELVTFCAIMHFREFQFEITDGQLALHLLRPCPLWVLKLGEWLGQFMTRFVALLVPSALLALLLGGDSASFEMYCAGLILSVPCAALIYLCGHFMIGAASLWVKQADPLFWFFQKCIFLLGCLLCPLALYPPPLAAPDLVHAVSRRPRDAGAMGNDAQCSDFSDGVWLADFVGAVVPEKRRLCQRRAPAPHAEGGRLMQRWLRSFDYLTALARANARTHLFGLGRTLTLGLLMFAQNFIFFLMWAVYFGAVKEVKGWHLQDVALLYGLVAFTIGLSLFCFDGMRMIAQHIRTGAIDAYLTRPRHPLPALLMSRSNASSLGDVLSGFFYTLVFYGLPLTKFPLFFVVALLAAIIFTATLTIFYSLAFWLKRNGRLSDQLFEMLIIFCVVPQHTQLPALQIAMYSILPAGFMGFLPVSLIHSFDWGKLVLLLAATLFYVCLAVVIFDAGVKRYRLEKAA
jgi:ABC-2 type transport system permease protein